jgi:hypothetical protein
MARFRSRPTEVEAEQWWPGRHVRGVRYRVEYEAEDAEGTRLIREGPYVTTIQGTDVPISPGEWVVTEPDGVHHYPIAPSVFATKYDPIEGSDPMHYRNGREAKPGDKVVDLNEGKSGVLYEVNAQSDTCNGRLAATSYNDPLINLKDCLHVDDFKAAHAKPKP